MQADEIRARLQQVNHQGLVDSAFCTDMHRLQAGQMSLLIESILLLTESLNKQQEVLRSCE